MEIAWVVITSAPLEDVRCTHDCDYRQTRIEKSISILQLDLIFLLTWLRLSSIVITRRCAEELKH